MNRLADAVVRVAFMLAGYACACLAASAMLHLLFLGGLGWTANEAAWIVTGSFVFSVPFVAIFIAYFAFVPALIGTGIVEILGLRDWLPYAIVGGLVGLCMIAMFWYAGTGQGALDDASPRSGMAVEDPYVVLSLIVAGMIGGIAYWAAAGRWAGAWRRPLMSRMP